MITTEQANTLRALIVAYRDAELADSFKGAGDPADTPGIEADLKVAKLELEVFIHYLEHGPQSVPAAIPRST